MPLSRFLSLARDNIPDLYTVARGNDCTPQPFIVRKYIGYLILFVRVVSEYNAFQDNLYQNVMPSFPLILRR